MQALRLAPRSSASRQAEKIRKKADAPNRPPLSCAGRVQALGPSRALHRRRLSAMHPSRVQAAPGPAQTIVQPASVCTPLAVQPAPGLHNPLCRPPGAKYQKNQGIFNFPGRVCADPGGLHKGKAWCGRACTREGCAFLAFVQTCAGVCTRVAPKSIRYGRSKEDPTWATRWPHDGPDGPSDPGPSP